MGKFVSSSLQNKQVLKEKFSIQGEFQKSNRMPCLPSPVVWILQRGLNQ